MSIEKCTAFVHNVLMVGFREPINKCDISTAMMHLNLSAEQVISIIISVVICIRTIYRLPQGNVRFVFAWSSQLAGFSHSPSVGRRPPIRRMPLRHTG